MGIGLEAGPPSQEQRRRKCHIAAQGHRKRQETGHHMPPLEREEEHRPREHHTIREERHRPQTEHQIAAEEPSTEDQPMGDHMDWMVHVGTAFGNNYALKLMNIKCP